MCGNWRDLNSLHTDFPINFYHPHFSADIESNILTTSRPPKYDWEILGQNYRRHQRRFQRNPGAEWVKATFALSDQSNPGRTAMQDCSTCFVIILVARFVRFWTQCHNSVLEYNVTILEFLGTWKLMTIGIAVGIVMVMVVMCLCQQDIGFILLQDIGFILLQCIGLAQSLIPCMLSSKCTRTPFLSHNIDFGQSACKIMSHQCYTRLQDNVTPAYAPEHHLWHAEFGAGQSGQCWRHLLRCVIICLILAMAILRSFATLTCP